MQAPPSPPSSRAIFVQHFLRLFCLESFKNYENNILTFFKYIWPIWPKSFSHFIFHSIFFQNILYFYDVPKNVMKNINLENFKLCFSTPVLVLAGHLHTKNNEEKAFEKEKFASLLQIVFWKLKRRYSYIDKNVFSLESSYVLRGTFSIFFWMETEKAHEDHRAWGKASTPGRKVAMFSLPPKKKNETEAGDPPHK